MPAIDPIALEREIIWGSKCLSNAAATKSGKYGIGIKMIILPTKLTSKIPRYPKLLKKERRSSRLVTKHGKWLCSSISSCYYKIGKNAQEIMDFLSKWISKLDSVGNNNIKYNNNIIKNWKVHL